MQAKFFLCLVFGVIVTFTEAEQFKFTNYRLVSLLPDIPIHIQLISEWEQNPDFDIWTRVKSTNERVNVLLSPNAFLKYSFLFKQFKISFMILEENIQTKIEEQQRSMSLTKNQKTIVGRFARYSEIMSYIDRLVLENSDIVSSYVAGTTYEKRNLKVVIIKTPNSKRKVWIDCGIHAREWMTPSTCIWIINKLVKGYQNFSPEVVSLLNDFEFHIMPLHNPDGYEYSHNTVNNNNSLFYFLYKKIFSIDFGERIDAQLQQVVSE